MKKTESGLPIVDATQLIKVLDKAKEKNLGVLVLGTVGIGKTYTMQKWFEKTYPQRLQLINYTAEQITSNYLFYGEKIFRDIDIPNNTLPYIGRLPIFIDDLGTEKIAKHYGSEIDVVENIILRLYHEKQILYATSNLNLEVLTERYGIRAVDRLREMCIIVVMEGPNYRTELFSKNQNILDEL